MAAAGGARVWGVVVAFALVDAALPAAWAEGPGGAAFRGKFEGYDVEEIPFALLTLDAPEAVTLPDDNMTEQLALGFATRFWDDPTDAFWVGSNGFLSLFKKEDAGCCEGQPIPSAADPDGLIAGFWTDLDPGQGGSLAFQRFANLSVPGQPAQPALAVEWRDVPGPGGAVTLQVVVFEDGAFDVRIADAAVPAGTKATVGAESFNGGRGVQVLHGDDLALQERAWRFRPVYVPLAPDLVIVGVSVDRPVQPTLPWRVKAEVRNDGIGTAEQSQVRLTATPEPGPLRGTSAGCPELVGSKLVNGLQPGQGANLTFTWAPPLDPANPAVPRVGSFRFDAVGVVLVSAEPELNLTNNAANATGAYLVPGLGGTDVLCTQVPALPALPVPLPLAASRSVLR